MELMTRKDMVSLTELAEQYSDEFPEYIIQSRMRSYNTLEFLRQWGNDINAEFDDRACEELIHQGRTASLTITPSLWIRRTHAVGMHMKQGKGRGVRAYPEIAADFHLWLDPKARLTIVRMHIRWPVRVPYKIDKHIVKRWLKCKLQFLKQCLFIVDKKYIVLIPTNFCYL